MTAPNGPILFNNSTGSDTAASGLGPSTAVTGAGASTTNASAVVTGIDTTGVTVGDLLWVDTSTGRQFSIIASVDSGSQVTCDETFGVTASGQTWAIGGKRATIDSTSSRVFLQTDRTQEFSIELEYTGTNYINSSSLDFSGSSNNLRVYGSGAQKPVIECTHNGKAFEFRSHFYAEQLKLINTNATKTASVAFYAISVSDIRAYITEVEVGESGNGFWRGFDRGAVPTLQLVDSVFSFCTDTAITTTGTCLAVNSSISDNGDDGFDISGDKTVLISGCIIANNGNRGFTVQTNSVVTLLIEGNVFYGNSANGFNQTNSYGPPLMIIRRNIFSENGTYGIGAAANLQDDPKYKIRYNAFYANSSGRTNNVTSVDETISSADPFVDAAAGDFNINNTAGGGAALRAVTVTLP